LVSLSLEEKKKMFFYSFSEGKKSSSIRRPPAVHHIFTRRATYLGAEGCNLPKSSAGRFSHQLLSAIFFPLERENLLRLKEI
jgi:hypothetical protein